MGNISSLNKNSKQDIINKKFFDDLIKFSKEFNNELDISFVFEALKNENCFLRCGKDEEMRPICVRTQDIIERYLTLLLSKKLIKNVTAIIHTPAPPTPLCVNPVNKVDIDCTNEDLIKDYSRSITIIERAQFLRDYLRIGGTLYSVFGKNGLSLRNLDQQKIFENEMKINRNKLFAIELAIDVYPSEMVGGIYFFTLNEKYKMIFAIKAYQAGDIVDGREWGLWLGLETNEKINERVNEILQFLNTNSNGAYFIRL